VNHKSDKGKDRYLCKNKERENKEETGIRLVIKVISLRKRKGIR
jgi:hypothetical protein